MRCKGIVLAAGRGERLGALTEKTPKPLLPVAGVPVIARLLECLVQAGVDEIGVGTGWRSSEVMDYVRKEFDQEAQVIYVEDYERGPLHTLVGTLKALEGGGTSIVVPADLVVGADDIASLLSAHAPDTTATLAVSTHGHGTKVYADELGKLGGVGMPITGNSEVGVSMMALVVDERFVEQCIAGVLSGESSVVAVLNRAIAAGENVGYYQSEAPWADIDDVTALLDANALVLRSSTTHSVGDVYVPQGDRVEVGEDLTAAREVRLSRGVTLEGPVLIQAGSSIGIGCSVGPDVSIGPQCRIGDRCDLRRTVVFAGATVMTGVGLDGAVVSGTTIVEEGHGSVTE